MRFSSPRARPPPPRARPDRGSSSPESSSEEPEPEPSSEEEELDTFSPPDFVRTNAIWSSNTYSYSFARTPPVPRPVPRRAFVAWCFSLLLLPVRVQIRVRVGLVPRLGRLEPRVAALGAGRRSSRGSRTDPPSPRLCRESAASRVRTPCVCTRCRASPPPSTPSPRTGTSRPRSNPSAPRFLVLALPGLFRRLRRSDRRDRPGGGGWRIVSSSQRKNRRARRAAQAPRLAHVSRPQTLLERLLLFRGPRLRAGFRASASSDRSRRTGRDDETLLSPPRGPRPLPRRHRRRRRRRESIMAYEAFRAATAVPRARRA